jgi:hypothetical protein
MLILLWLLIIAAIFINYRWPEAYSKIFVCFLLFLLLAATLPSR